jgi:hypothetical protein
MTDYAQAEPHRKAPEDALLSRGRPLDGDVRSTMEARFGHDFSQVRIHSDEQAAAAAREQDAIAFTTASDIVFGAGRYRPGTPFGRRLLAHELAHVVQQADSPPSLNPVTGTPESPAERAADQAAHVFGRGPAPDRSLSLTLRDTLRATRTTGPARQRAVTTWAGEFDTDKYDNILDAAGHPVGVDIELKFKPGTKVNAELIGLTQTATSRDSGSPLAVNPTVAARSIPAGKPGEGAHIDHLATHGNPLYATNQPGAGDTLATTSTTASFGHHGFRFTDRSGTLHKDNALLKDNPALDPHGPNSSQIFESTAVAIKGAQLGTWYGSVSWGWRSDAANAFTKLPLTLVSNDVPSGVFAAAAGLWGANPTSTGSATIPLPMIQGKYTKVAGASLIQDPAAATPAVVGALDKNTRVEVTAMSAVSGRPAYAKVTVVNGSFAGRVGWVLGSALADVVTP